MKDTKIGLLITGGEGPSRDILNLLASKADIIAAADSGMDTAAEADILPEYAIGDMDSIINKKVLHQIPSDNRHILSVDKDDSDTEAGLSLLRDKGCGSIILAGGGGGRLDHLFAVEAIFDRENPPRLWITDEYTVIYIEEKGGRSYTFAGLKGETASFFPLGLENARAKTTGLKWPLDDFEMKKGVFSLSNSITEDILSIKMRYGRMIMLIKTNFLLLQNHFF